MCAFEKCQTHEIVSLNSFLVSRAGQDSKISNLSIMSLRKHFYKVQYVLELIKKMKEKTMAFGTAK